ncbi:LysR family transcriptional regulator [Paenibacillus sp. NPDC058071]|uniref:LysR family transcriptional regulator n=1 Tax=Paenibacillus sp. NPDC058071 TaxID=3346326 RepID=UPI0036D89307
MQLENYRIFLQTAKTGNFTKAAQALHMTQPSVSYAIKQLEEECGVKLFDRLSKGVRLTPEGTALLGYVEQSFALLGRGEQKLKQLARLEDGELRIGASGPIIRHVLLPHLDRFHVNYPDVRIRLLQLRSSEVARQLQENTIDLGLLYLPFADDALVAQPLLAIQDCFIVGRAYERLADSPVDAVQLQRIPLLLPTSGSSTRTFVEQWFASQGVSKEPDFELTSTETMIEFARLGYGAVFVARQFARKELEEGSLIELRPTVPIPPREIGVVTRRDAALPSASAVFLRLLTADESSAGY